MEQTQTNRRPQEPPDPLIKTAKTLGITMPPSLLLLADEVIQ
jgi:hypothetical protein